MAHALDFSLGRAAIAFKANNGKPWHGYGAHILDSDGPAEIAAKAGLDYRVMSSPALYTVPNIAFDADQPESAENPKMLSRSYENRAVLYRDDTLEALSVMSDSHYTPAQPIQLLEGLFELTKDSGYEMDVAGALKGGRVVWALAKRKDGDGAIGRDIIQPYVLLLTSYDGTYARTARLTSVRVVCQNTVSLSGMLDAKTTSKQRNSAEFSLEKSNSLLSDLGQHDKAFADYLELSKQMAKQRMTPDTLQRFFAKLYAPKAFEDETKWLDSPLSWDKDKVTSNAKNNVATLHDIFKDSPGADLPSANGTLWGALNAVTFMQDHMARTKEDKRWESATIGNGNRVKDAALELAVSMLQR
jgi:phage/plasmid-like protein (TIGR03299 family)